MAWGASAAGGIGVILYDPDRRLDYENSKRLREAYLYLDYFQLKRVYRLYVLILMRGILKAL